MTVSNNSDLDISWTSMRKKNYFERWRRTGKSWAPNNISEILYIFSRSELHFAFLGIDVHVEMPQILANILTGS